MPVIVTARETANEITDCVKKAVVVRGRSGVLMCLILRAAPARDMSTPTHFLVS
jgi:hypothetical protein